jgi:uncharacterized protein with HEPN domain
MNRILKKEEFASISNARKIVDVRNRIIHGYDTVSDDVIWSLLVKHIPLLRIEVEELLNE